MGISAELEASFQIAAAISAICSASVLIPTLLSESVTSLKKKVFLQIITIVSLCDLLGSVSCAIGFQDNGTAACLFQSIIGSFFYVASWIWTSVLAFQLYSIIIHGRPHYSMTSCHLFSWSVSLVSLLLPLTTNSFGSTQQDSASWCYLSGNPDTALIWFYVAYAGVLWGSVAFMIFLWVMLFYKSKLFSSVGRFPVIRSATNAIILYPLGLMLIWFPSTIMTPLLYIQQISLNEFIVSSVLATQNGTVLAGIYFYRSKEARQKLKALWNCIMQSCFRSKHSTPTFLLFQMVLDSPGVDVPVVWVEKPGALSYLDSHKLEMGSGIMSSDHFQSTASRVSVSRSTYLSVDVEDCDVNYLSSFLNTVTPTRQTLSQESFPAVTSVTIDNVNNSGLHAAQFAIVDTKVDSTTMCPENL